VEVRGSVVRVAAARLRPRRARLEILGAIALAGCGASFDSRYRKASAPITARYASQRTDLEAKRDYEIVGKRCPAARHRHCGYLLADVIASGGTHAYLRTRCGGSDPCAQREIDRLDALIREWYPRAGKGPDPDHSSAAGMTAFEDGLRQRHNAATVKAWAAPIQASLDAEEAELAGARRRIQADIDEENRQIALAFATGLQSAGQAMQASANAGAYDDGTGYAAPSPRATRRAPSYAPAAPPVPVAPTFTSTRLLLFGGTSHKDFLGCLNCDQFDSDSVWNNMSTYGFGNSFGKWNRYGEYGNAFSATSPCNAYATSAPVVVDDAGGFYGYFTINAYAPNSVCGATGNRSICAAATELCSHE
jgi:hypothetical protein